MKETNMKGLIMAAETFTRQYLTEEMKEDFDILFFLTRSEWSINFLREVIQGNDAYKEKIEEAIYMYYIAFKEDASKEVILFGSSSENLFSNLLNYIGYLTPLDKDIEVCLDVLVRRYVYIRIPKNLEKISKNFEIPRILVTKDCK